MPGPRHREREGGRAGGQERAQKAARFSELLWEAAASWPARSPRSISSARNVPGSGLRVRGLRVLAPPTRLTPPAACSGGNFAGASHLRSWALRPGSHWAPGFPEKGSSEPGRPVGAGSSASLALI